MSERVDRLILVDCQVLQSKSSLRGFGSYGYRVLSELIQGGSTDLVLLLRENGQDNFSKEIRNFANMNNLKIATFSNERIGRFGNRVRRLSKSSENYVAKINEINPRILLILAPLALPHEQTTEILGLKNTIKKVCVYYDNFQIQEKSRRMKAERIETLRRYNLLRFFDLVISISEQSSEQLRTDFKDLPVYTHYLPIRVQTIECEKSILLSIVGSVSHKNLDGLRKSYGIYAKRENKPIPLVVIGVNCRSRVKGLFIRAFYKTQIRETSRIARSELEELLRMSKFVIIASLREGLSMPYIEALEHGAIPISANSIPAARILNCDKFCFDPTRPESLFETIQTLGRELAVSNRKIEQQIQLAIEKHNQKHLNIRKVLENAFVN